MFYSPDPSATVAFPQQSQAVFPTMHQQFQQSQMIQQYQQAFQQPQLVQQPQVVPQPYQQQFPASQPQFQGYWMYCPSPAMPSNSANQKMAIALNPIPSMLANNKSDVLPRESKKSMMYKTVLCRQFMEYGRCNYGERCGYAHGEEDRRQPPPRHPKYRTEQCKNMSQQGHCPYGSRCHFLHGDVINEMSQSPPLLDGASSGYASPASFKETSSPLQQNHFGNIWPAANFNTSFLPNYTGLFPAPKPTYFGM